MSETEDAADTPLVAPSDVRAIDRVDGIYRLPCGVGLEATQITDRVQPGDRTSTGRLTKAAAERIADELSAIARQILGGDESMTLQRAERVLATHEPRGWLSLECTQGCGTYPCEAVRRARRVAGQETSHGASSAP